MIVLFIEAVIYLQVRAQALLFIKIKYVEMQERQMVSLLDLVPDSVFICAKTADEQDPEGLYANFKMNQFFGRDDISKGNKNRVQQG